jgi:hypothetical protein
MTAGRPYFNKSIAELEALYASAPDDPHLNQELVKELNHRSTGRANALLNRLHTKQVGNENMQITVPVTSAQSLKRDHTNETTATAPHEIRTIAPARVSRRTTLPNEPLHNEVVNT